MHGAASLRRLECMARPSGNATQRQSVRPVSQVKVIFLAWGGGAIIFWDNGGEKGKCFGQFSQKPHSTREFSNEVLEMKI